VFRATGWLSLAALLWVGFMTIAVVLLGQVLVVVVGVAAVIYYLRAVVVATTRADYPWVIALFAVPALYVAALWVVAQTGLGLPLFKAVGGDSSTGAGGWAQATLDMGGIGLLLFIPALLAALFVVGGLPLLSLGFLGYLLVAPPPTSTQRRAAKPRQQLRAAYVAAPLAALSTLGLIGLATDISTVM
jgi:hypothetical protein